MRAAVLLAAVILGSVSTASPVEASSPAVCIRMPWQSKDKCSSKLVYAKSSAPKDVRNELERLGAIVDATQTMRIALNKEWTTHYKSCKPGPTFYTCLSSFKSKLTSLTQADLEKRESEAWLNLYYFAKDFRQHVLARKYSTIVRWGTAIQKCYPNCQYNYP